MTYLFILLWSFICMCAGALLMIGILSMCRSSGRADECAECMRIRERDAQMMRRYAAQHGIHLPTITPAGCGLPEEAKSVPQRPGKLS